MFKMNFLHWYQNPEQSVLKSSLTQTLKAIDEIKLLNHFLQIGSQGLNIIKPILGTEQSFISISSSKFNAADIVSLDDLLPIQTKSIDFILVMHSFETSNNAHALIREINRVIKDDGLVFVVALNKPSFINIIAIIQDFFVPKLDIKRTIPAHKMDDWFSLLGFSKIKQNYLFNKNSLDKLFNGKLAQINQYLFQCGTVYCCLYKKTVLPLTLDTERWNKPIALKPALIETRNQHKETNKI